MVPKKTVTMVGNEGELPVEGKVTHRKVYFTYLREVLKSLIIYWETMKW